MGKKRGKDKNSREEEDTDVIGRVFILSVVWGGNIMWQYSGEIYSACFLQVHHADTLKREQTKPFSRNSLEILIGQVARIVRMKKIKKKSTPVWKKSRKHRAYGCA